MLKNITLGQYYPGNTLVHRLDPRTKIVLSLLLLITIFLIDTVWGYIIYAAFVIIVAVVARVGVRTVLRSVRPLLFIIIFTFVLNIFFSTSEMRLKSWDLLKFPADRVVESGSEIIVPSDWYLVHWGWFRISVVGLLRAVEIAVRLILLILATSLLTLTTSPMQLTDGLESLLQPLRKIGFPVHEMAMMISIAIRFIPTLIDETDRIMKAQTARGADFNHGNILARAKNMVPLLVPLFVSAFKRADELAVAMEARCYRGGEGRTKMRVLHMGRADIAAYCITVPLCILLIVVF